jgi:hypothetical protein
MQKYLIEMSSALERHLSLVEIVLLRPSASKLAAMAILGIFSGVRDFVVGVLSVVVQDFSSSIRGTVVVANLCYPVS